MINTNLAANNNVANAVEEAANANQWERNWFNRSGVKVI